MLPTQTGFSAKLNYIASACPAHPEQNLAWRRSLEVGQDTSVFSDLIPDNCPIPAQRIKNCTPQMIHDRPQLMSRDGAFAFTDLNQLPGGGVVLKDEFSEDQIDCVILGDMGAPGNQQESVVGTVTQRITQTPPGMRSLVLGVGDWVYPRGPHCLAEAECNRTVHTVLETYSVMPRVSEVIGLLGNHEWGDHRAGADPSAFMTLARQFGITMPARYFCKSFIGKKFDAHIVAVDSTVLAADEQQQAWVKNLINDLNGRKYSQAKPQWIVLAAHHPYQSFGHHAGQSQYLSDMLGETLKKVDLYVSGHEHDLEYIKPEDGRPPLVISGTASTVRCTGAHDADLLNTNVPGYATVQFSENEIKIKFLEVSVNGQAGERELVSDTLTYQGLNYRNIA